MKYFLKRSFSLVLAFCLILGALPGLDASAASPTPYSRMSSSYKNSVYYDRLMAVELTGNQITDLISVAVSQLGYHESDDPKDLSGTASKGDKNYTEYGNLTKTAGNAWCASFVSWCFRMAGIPESVMPTAPGCGRLRKSVYNNGATWHSVDSGYKPKAGDLVLYEKMDNNYRYYIYASRDANGVPSSSSHVGIVVSDYNSSTGTYSVIDGNGVGYVKHHTGQKLYSAGKTKNGSKINRIQGFVTPAYTTGTGSSYNGSTVDNSVVVTLTKPTSTSYVAKQSIGSTNATLVTRISKTSGSHISRSGMVLRAADGTLIKDYWETVSVGNSTTVFHSWYDINAELGVTLKPATTYQYQFHAEVNGKIYYGNTYTFTTTGSAASYTVTFDPNGGTVSPTSKTVTKGNVYGVLPTPSYPGYEFEGWYTAGSGGDLITSTTNVNLSRNQTLYARWSAQELYIALDGNGGSVDYEAISVYYGGLFGPLPTPTRPGYTFTGWYTSDYDGILITSESRCHYTSDNRIYAHWRPTVTPTITVTLDHNDGSGSCTYTELTPGQISGTLPTPTRDGYSFLGWYTAPTGGDRVASTRLAALTTDTRLYAHWEQNDQSNFNNEIRLQIGSPYISVNGVTSTIDEQGTVPVIVNNRTLMPIRAIIEAMGGTVEWKPSTRVAALSKDGRTLNLRIDQSTAWDDAWRTYPLDTPPVIINNRTLMPVRVVVEFFDGTVEWEPSTRTAIIHF